MSFGRNDMYFVQCLNSCCDARTKRYKTKEEAITMWNKGNIIGVSYQIMKFQWRLDWIENYLEENDTNYLSYGNDDQDED